mgnify:FL=1
MIIQRKVQKAKSGTHLVTVPPEIIGPYAGRDLKANFKWNNQVKGWTMEILER